MNMLSTEAVIFLCFAIAVVTPPFMAAFLLISGIKYERLNYPALILSGLMTVLWVPVIVTSPMVISDYLLPALQAAN